MEWFNGLTDLERALVVIGTPAAVLFLLQLGLRLFGGFDHDADMNGIDVHHDGGPGDMESSGFLSQSLSLMNICIFIMTLCWTSFGFIQSEWPAFIAILLGGVLGVAGVVSSIFAWRMLYKLTEDNTAGIWQAVARRGTVYATVPANRSGIGQITVEISGALRQVDAVTESETPIRTGVEVLVLRSYTNGTVLVAEPNF